MAGETRGARARTGIARGYSLVEDVIYLGLGLLLAAIVVLLLAGSFIGFGASIVSWTIAANVTKLLDQILLILLLVELLYTVQVSFREHALVPEPFLLVGLISAIRRILVLTAVMGEKTEQGEDLRALIPELAVLAALVLALAISLVLLRRRDGKRDPPRA